MSELTPKTRTLVILLAIVLHLVIAIPMAWMLNIWVDEASTLYATQHGFLTAFQTAAIEQKQAPLYFWILSVWRYLGESIFFARLFSIICSLFAIKLFAGLAQRLFSPAAALMLTLFLAFHPYLIWASVEIRVYSLVILLSVVLLHLFFEGFGNDDRTEPHSSLLYPKVWFLFAVIISLYTNYYLGFVIAGLGASLLVSGKWRDVRTFTLLMVVAGIAFFPMILVMRAEFMAKTGGFLEERTVLDGIQTIWNHTLTFILPTEIFPGSERSAVSLVRIWIVRFTIVLIATMAAVKYKQITQNTITLGCIAAVTGLFFFGAYFVVGPSYIVIRHASMLFVPLVLFLASIIADTLGNMRPERKKIAAFALGVVVLASFSYATVHLFPNMTKRGDWVRVGEFIQQNESPGQPIVVFITYEALALRYNYSGVNRVLPDDRFFEYGPEATPGSPDSLNREIAFVISTIPADAEHLWLAVGEKCTTTEACIPLQNYIEANYTIETEKDFYQERLYLLKKKHQ